VLVVKVLVVVLGASLGSLIWLVWRGVEYRLDEVREIFEKLQADSRTQSGRLVSLESGYESLKRFHERVNLLNGQVMKLEAALTHREGDATRKVVESLLRGQ
jgi:hypothetical protein